MAAGIVGSIVGQLVGQIVQSVIGKLMEQFGGDMVGKAISNLVTGKLGEALNGVVDQLPMPRFAKDIAKGVVENVIGKSQQEGVDPECQCAVDQTFGKEAEEAARTTADDLLQRALEMAKEETEESSGSEKSGRSGKGGATSWFAILARALGEIAGKHLDKMIELSDKMQDLTDKEDAGEMSAVQAEFQAESQMFKMASEAASTAIKSIGEGFQSMARKQ